MMIVSKGTRLISEASVIFSICLWNSKHSASHKTEKAGNCIALEAAVMPQEMVICSCINWNEKLAYTRYSCLSSTKKNIVGLWLFVCLQDFGMQGAPSCDYFLIVLSAQRNVVTNIYHKISALISVLIKTQQQQQQMTPCHSHSLWGIITLAQLYPPTVNE